MIHLIFVTKYRNKDRNNLKLHRKIAPKWGRSFLIKSVKLDPFAECDAILKILIYLALQFQSTPSLRKVTARIAAIRTAQTFQSTPSLRKVTCVQPCKMLFLFISIHTFLTEGDLVRIQSSKISFDFNPHLPCGRWRCHSFLFHALRNFNPHLPCGRWPRSLAHHIPSQHFNPHLPCRRWRCLVAVDMIVKVFQSTPSLQKVTQGKRNKTAIAKFQSTPSLQKVTATYFACIKRLSISIHTFLAEGDRGCVKLSSNA